MAKNTQNVEGLTFEEWVCAAGVARVDGRSTPTDGHKAWPWVMPYSTSDTYYRPAPNPFPGTVLLLCYTSRPPAGIKHRATLIHYPKKIREAWRRGEDPTEWRSSMEVT